MHRYLSPFPIAATLVFLTGGPAPRVQGAADLTFPDNFQPALPAIPDRIFQLTDFGAVGDGATLNTAGLTAVDETKVKAPAVKKPVVKKAAKKAAAPAPEKKAK